MGEFLSVGAFSLPGHCSLLEGGHGGGNGGHAWRQNGAAMFKIVLFRRGKV